MLAQENAGHSSGCSGHETQAARCGRGLEELSPSATGMHRARQGISRCKPDLRQTTENTMSELAALTARIDRLEHGLWVQQGSHAIRRVQYTYGYFIDKSLYNEVVGLFSDSGDVWFLGGIYRGKAGVRRLYPEAFPKQFTQGHNGPRYGWLLDHPQLTMVIDVAPGRDTAQVRGRSMMQAGLH